MARLLKRCVFIAFIVTTSCYNNDCNWELDDQALRDQTGGLSLTELYEFHLRLCKQCTPPRSTLAWEVAKYGEPAKLLALARAASGDIRDFSAAIDVVGSVNARYDTTCTPVALRRLEDRASSLSRLPATVDALRRGVRTACFPSENSKDTIPN